MQLLKYFVKKSVIKGSLRWYSSLYVSKDLCTTACWTRYSLPTRANRLAGLVDSSVMYSEDNATNFWISSRWGVTKEVKLHMEDDGMVSQISAGRQHLAVLTTSGNVYTSTENYFSSSIGSLIISKVTSGFKQVACGLDHTLALTASGQVFSCGWGADGQTGNGTEFTLTDVAPVVGEICYKNIIKISTCADSCFAIADDGMVFAWGNNEYGQLALNTSEIQVTTPQQCQLPSLSEGIVDIASGGAFTCFLTDSGRIYCIGNITESRDQLCLLHKENTVTSPVSSLYAGLHYVVACCQETLLVWGHYPGTNREAQPLKVSAPNSNSIHSVSPMLHELVLIMDS